MTTATKEDYKASYTPEVKKALEEAGGGTKVVAERLPTINIRREGGYLRGTILGFRSFQSDSMDSPMEFVSLEFVATNGKVEAWDRDARESVSVTVNHGDKVELIMSAGLNSLRDLAKGTPIMLVYLGLKPSTKKGRQPFHAYDIILVGQK